MRKRVTLHSHSPTLNEGTQTGSSATCITATLLIRHFRYPICRNGLESDSTGRLETLALPWPRV